MADIHHASITPQRPMTGGQYWWRPTAPSYTNNELYMDVVETINCIVDEQGTILGADVVVGVVTMLHPSTACITDRGYISDIPTQWSLPSRTPHSPQPSSPF